MSEVNEFVAFLHDMSQRISQLEKELEDIKEQKSAKQFFEVLMKQFKDGEDISKALK